MEFRIFAFRKTPKLNASTGHRIWELEKTPFLHGVCTAATPEIEHVLFFFSTQVQVSIDNHSTFDVLSRRRHAHLRDLYYLFICDTARLEITIEFWMCLSEVVGDDSVWAWARSQKGLKLTLKILRRKTLAFQWFFPKAVSSICCGEEITNAKISLWIDRAMFPNWQTGGHYFYF